MIVKLFRWTQWVRWVGRDILVAGFAARDPRTPAGLRLLTLAAAAYAFSPVDLVPDVIPVLGQLDDLVIVPAGLALVTRLLPLDVLADARRKAAEWGPRMYVAMGLFIALWILLMVGLGFWLFG